MYRQRDPARGNAGTVAHGRVPLPQPRRLHPDGAGGQGEAVVKRHAVAQRLQCRLRDFALHLHPVGLGQLPARVADACLQRAVVGEQQQAFGIVVEASGRVNAGQVDEIGQHRATVLVAELAEHQEGLVEKNQAGHGGRTGCNAAKLA